MMEIRKCKNFLKHESYVHCTICGNYRNINSFAHRKSLDHQKRLAAKLRKISFHLLKKKKTPVVVHDAHWPQKDFKRFCHFCGDQYSEHHVEEDFVIESVGSLYHHACLHHSECVKGFLKKNYREEKTEKFCIKNEELDIYLQKVPDAKQKYLKKMDFINNMVLNQIRDSEEERKALISSVKILHCKVEPSFNGESLSDIYENSCEAMPGVSMKSMKNNDLSKVPPWLEDVSSQSSECQPEKPVIGPTLNTLLKHVAAEKKKGLLKNRVGANFKRHAQSSSKWLPSYQGVWNQGRRKQLKYQFNRRNKK